MGMAPISPRNPSLMSGSQADHEARMYPMSTKFAVEVSVCEKVEVEVVVVSVTAKKEKWNAVHGAYANSG